MIIHKTTSASLSILIDEEGYAKSSSNAYEQAESAAAEVNAYPVVYPEPFNSIGCGYGPLTSHVKTLASKLASEMGLDLSIGDFTELNLSLNCGDEKTYRLFEELLTSQLEPLREWILDMK